ncbi:MAG: hypothetical protein HDR28_00080 [Lachnospiraceae bacterium]|nr:hypothetical protein [Lachnospiraceae bacterium]
MARYDLKLLDCTLRDGGYINNWTWGFQRAKKIIRYLVLSRVDIVEVGFLRNIDSFDENVTVGNKIEELNEFLPDNPGGTMFAAMAMRSNYDVGKLSPYAGKGIEMIRVTAHDYDIDEGMDFAGIVKEKGYKVSVNPINIMGYSDEEILRIVDKVNHIQPYQFSIVDTFGSMKRRDLDRIVSIVDNNLDRSIRVALHLHENMSMASCLAQNFVDKHLNRPIAVDGSLMGMGRTPGNLPIELMADYLNEYTDAIYDIDYMMDAIQDYIIPFKGDMEWGYSPTYFLSAKFNLHRNYAEFFLNKGDLTNRDINHIFARFDMEKKTVYDESYAEEMYEVYQNQMIDDKEDRERLKKCLHGKKVLVVAPGVTARTYKKQICDFIHDNHDAVITIGVNYVPEDIPVQYAFFSNNKRFGRIEDFPCKTIVTSNLTERKADYRIDYDSLSGAFSQSCNSFIMLLKLLKQLDVTDVTVAGADGYIKGGDNYFDSSIRTGAARDNNYNHAVIEALHNLNYEIVFLTPSAYNP